jgi:inosine/xanthosine triphosphate pyrophosphatase family protein
MAKINIVFITGNEGKRREVSEILGDQFNVINLTP